jgi:superfamily II RNA helicase
LKLNCDVLLSKFGFKFSLRRYNSAFHLTYSMILNLIRVEGAEPEALMRQGGH